MNTSISLPTCPKFTFRLGQIYPWPILMCCLLLFRCTSRPEPKIALEKGQHIVLIGNNLGSRMMNYGFFETEIHLRFPEHQLFIRNMCDGGNTPGFRPHASRNSPWAFEGAEQFQDELATPSGSEGHFDSPDEWLTRLQADVILAFFGFNESFEGPEGVENFQRELAAFIEHTLDQTYNGQTPPQLVLVSPIAFEKLEGPYDLPDGEEENSNLKLYTYAMRQVAAQYQVPMINVFDPTMKWYQQTEQPLTIDGSQLNETGYRQFATFLVDQIFGQGHPAEVEESNKSQVLEAVEEKNWTWHQDYKIPNGVHAYGRRFNPFGPDNYPAEIEKIRQMTANRDTAIWQTVQGQSYDLKTADAHTRTLPVVETNYDPAEHGNPEYLYGKEALASIKTAPGYRVELFASEREFEDLANPVQITFDDEGRLWVATMPSYPHYRAGDSKPNDKIIILEDTDGDGKADKQTTFADHLHLPVGFELAPEGVYISQGTNLMLFKDTDGDDEADSREIIMSGFDDHDTHHAHSAYEADPSGAIYMGEGVFLHTNVETSYGPVRATNGGFYRFNPQRRRLERTAQLSIPNPWGIIFDDWGQNFFAETSSPDVRWMMPGTVKPRYGEATPNSPNIIEEAHRVRPTSGLEIISSRHFPDEVQGDLLINNTIGFLGMKQHQMIEDGTGFTTRHRKDLIWSTDKNFRPVDMEFAPDGSLYLVDWHNVLIGHMQHNARDPFRDHVHGRIYRITYPSRPLVEPAKVAGASVKELLENLKLPEFRTRYRSRRALRAYSPEEVLPMIRLWVDQLDDTHPDYEHHLLEALWVSWGLNKVDRPLLEKLLQAKDYHARAAAVRVLRYTGHQVPNQTELLMASARDPHGRVRLEAITAASWLNEADGLKILHVASQYPLDEYMRPSYETALAHLQGKPRPEEEEKMDDIDLKGPELDLYVQGKSIYSREGFCITCHQEDGGGLTTSGFPPLANTKWVLGNDERLIKIVLKGLQGPIEVKGKDYPGQVPMTPFGGMLKDEEVAAVLTYVRNSFGNSGEPILPEEVERVRAAINQKDGFYSPNELLKEHPLETENMD